MEKAWKKRTYNRLLERGNGTTPTTFKMDDRSKAVARTLLKAGYANIGEMFIDLLYREANRLNPCLCLPEVSGIKGKKDELTDQLKELQRTVKSQMAVL